MDVEGIVFLVEHAYTTDGGGEETKTIGVYSTREAAEQAIGRLRMQPGFSERPDGFNIDAYNLDQDGWSEGFVTVRTRS